LPASPTLSLLEARVVGVLVEKERTVPDSYPLTLNALVAGCNQKTSRDPVIEASEAEVQGAIDRLKSLSMVVESSGGRVSRYTHNAGKVLGIPPQSMALLAVLFLRGPQTAGELRINSERLHRFGDILSVEAFLRELAERRDGALVRELPRMAGAREARWMHLLSGVPDESLVPPGEATASDAISMSEMATLRAKVDALEREVASLRETVSRLSRELGITT
jgi:uncharacterized protein YceH (UPF0502 family)